MIIQQRPYLQAALNIAPASCLAGSVLQYGSTKASKQILSFDHFRPTILIALFVPYLRKSIGSISAISDQTKPGSRIRPVLPQLGSRCQTQPNIALRLPMRASFSEVTSKVALIPLYINTSSGKRISSPLTRKEAHKCWDGVLSLYCCDLTDQTPITCRTA